LVESEAAERPQGLDERTARTPAPTRLRRILLSALDNIVWVILGVSIAGFSLAVPGFASLENFNNIVYHSVFVGALAIPVTYVLISGYLDLSVGSTVGLAAILSSWLSANSPYASGLAVNPFAALVAVLLVGAAVGYVNGAFVTRLGVNSFLMTLASLIIVAGIAQLITQGNGVSLLPDSFRLIDTIRPLGIPLMVFLVGLFYVAFEFVLRRTQFGRHLYVIGGNRTAARDFGIQPGILVRRVFVFSGLMAALTGWLLAARLNGASPGIGSTLLFDVLAAAVIGGVSLSGGVGSLRGVLGGVLLLGAVQSALNIMTVSPYVVQLLRGVLVLVAIVVDAAKRKFR
jgi:ribose transport system permease protein